MSTGQESQESQWQKLVLDGPLEQLRNAQPPPQMPAPTPPPPARATFDAAVLEAAADDSESVAQLRHKRVEALRQGDHIELERNPASAEQRLRDVLNPPPEAYAFRPWQTPIQRTVDALRKKNDELKRRITSLYHDAHLRLYMLDMLTPQDYADGNLDASLLHWITGQFCLSNPGASPPSAMPNRLTHPEFFMTAEEKNHIKRNKRRSSSSDSEDTYTDLQ